MGELANIFTLAVISHMLLDVARLRTYSVCRHLGHDVENVDFCELFRADSVGMLIWIVFSCGGHERRIPNRSSGMSLT